MDRPSLPTSIPIGRLGEFHVPHLCSPTLLFLRRITHSRRHMAASSRLARPCAVRAALAVPPAAAAPRGQGRCRPPPLVRKGAAGGGKRQGRPTARKGWGQGRPTPRQGWPAPGRGQHRGRGGRRRDRERGESREKGADRWAPLPCVGETNVQNSRMVNCERFSYLNGQEYPVLEFNGQNQTQAILGWSKMNFFLNIIFV